MPTFHWSEEVATELDCIRRDHPQLTLVIDNGCCGGTTFLLHDQEVSSRYPLLGEVAGVPVTCTPTLTRTVAGDHFDVVVRRGVPAAGFSIAARYGIEFSYRRGLPDDPSGHTEFDR